MLGVCDDVWEVIASVISELESVSLLREEQRNAGEACFHSPDSSDYCKTDGFKFEFARDRQVVRPITCWVFFFLHVCPFPKQF